MKRLLQKRWARYLAAIVFLASFGVALSSSQLFAAPTIENNALAYMGSECHKMPKTGKEVGDADTQWYKCETVQDAAKSKLGCDGQMFYSVTRGTGDADASVTKTLWYVTPEKYAACVEKAQAQLDLLNSNDCKNMLHNPVNDDNDSANWKKCEKAQNALSVVGCSGKMFGPDKDSVHYSPKPGVLNACKEQIEEARTTLLTAPDGTKSAAADAAPIPADAGGGGANSGGDGSGSSCAGGAMGWLFCPLINYMTKTIQLVAGMVDNLMTVKFLSSESGGKSIEGIWRAVLAVANILLVIAFMFIILSQSTSAGLSNYGIKRMLPRLIIAAILMNLSFYICAIAIDFSNIIGASVMGFLLGSGNSIQAGVTAATGGGGDTGFLSSAGNAAGTVVAGIGLIALLFFLLTPLILGMLAFFVAIIGRQVILLVLVLVSPLAFVAWLLPNTEQYFKKWWQLFFQLLVLYPMVMAVFGAALLLSNLIGASASEGINLTGAG